ncbi:ring-cleaving dioxygenase [Haloglomus salinum]|uniref:ring-cleaving dioxygenase n=1 Tax=Haloglomus salinum TaxID=2962673 RepID=UPI0020C9A428|nr:ring-cleaving dioxygenase [Haloglomus salinum]
MVETTGIHHVTAIGGDPTRNAAFYVETLGLRLVKRTVNHDDTNTYHLYFGDGAGTPGTNITFFPWTDDGRQGEFGAGQTQYTAFSVPEGSLSYWADRLADHEVDAERLELFGEERLRFTDPDGIGLELVAEAAERPGPTWDDSPVPATHQIRGFAGVTLALADPNVTAGVLESIGYGRVAEDDDDGATVTRYDTGADGIGTWVDLVATDAPRGRMGVGTVHHVAFRLADEAEQHAMQETLEAVGMDPTEVIDRKYFTAIYAREPEGVLFEFATMGPGFDADEPVESLGERLALPEWLEDEREAIEAALPDFEPPRPAAASEASADD